MNLYVLGVIIAISSGCVNNLGVLFQKKVINDHREEPEFLRSLIKSPLWVFGLILQILIGGAILYMIAQALIGPSLVPGLMSGGLIVLALGSTMILKEKLRKTEISGILLMILGIFSLSLSQLSINLAVINILEQVFIIRLSIFTGAIFLAYIIIHFTSKYIKKSKGIFFALKSGLVYSLNSVWIGPLVAVLTRIFSSNFNMEELLLFFPALVIILICTAYGIIFAQKAFQNGQVNILSPLIGVPGQIIPVLIFFLIYNLVPASSLNVLFLIIGLVLIIVSSFLLATSQVRLEEIQISED